MQTITTEPKKLLRISIAAFANELFRDLPTLYKQHSEGVFLSVLVDYYGESIQRVTQAIKKLEERDRVKLRKAKSNAYYIIPYNSPEITGLSVLQKDCFDLIEDMAHGRLLKTNYAHLSKALECSNGGIRSAVLRLVELQFVTIVQPGQRGLSNSLVLQINQKEPIETS